MTAILSDEQITELYRAYIHVGNFGKLEYVFQLAARMGVEHAAGVCDKRGCDCADAIRAETAVSTEAKPPRS